jgi:CSLREA domain-containing protein/uncharacterized repeat protein (TIGR01451 family)
LLVPFLRKLAVILLSSIISGLALSLFFASIAQAGASVAAEARSSGALAAAAVYTVTKTADTNDGSCNADCSLREAVVAANANSGVDTIIIPAGTYNLTHANGDLDITDSASLQGAGAGLTIINASFSFSDRVFDVAGAGVAISGVTIRNGRVTSGSGGGVNLNSSSTVTLSFSTVYSNSADSGGGIRNAGGKLILDNVTVYSNTATSGSGGGVRTENGAGALTITNSSIYSNTASTSGGGLYVASGAANVFTTTLGPANRALNGNGGGLAVNTNGVAAFTNVSVVSNTAASDGGGGENLGALSFNNSVIQANTALSATGSGNGGGLNNQGGQLTLTGVTLNDNVATGMAGGGGLRNSLSGVVTINDSTLAGNQATDTIGNGGAILNSSGQLIIDNSAIGVLGNGNSSGLNGGGLSTASGTAVTITNSSLISNSAGDDGGGIDATGTILYIANTSLMSNTIRLGGVGDGGALRSDGGGVATLISVTVSGNVAEYGGGLLNLDATMTIISSTISYNTARNGSGGGIDNRRETLTPTLVITGSSIFSNTAANGNGGGLRSIGSTASVDIDNSTISYNRVTNGNGGGLRNENGSTLRLANVTLAYNDRSPSGAGEGISVNGGTVLVHDTLIANNDTQNCSGALTSLGFNLDSGNTCLFSGTGDLTNTAPSLGPLQSNGGPTWSHALLSGSAGINQGDNVSGCTTASGEAVFTIDQRGFTRPVSARCDIGAVEFVSGDVAVGLTNNRSTVIPGELITYTLRVTNTSGASLTGVAVNDSLPAALTGATWTCSASGGSSCPASGSGSISTTANLAGGGRATFTITSTVASSATGTLTNTATAAAPIGYNDPTGNNTATDADPLTPQADMGITNTDGQTSAIPGTPLTYTIVVTNAGPSDAPDTAISDTFPAALTNVTWECATTGGASCPASGNGDLNVNITLAANSEVTFTVSGDIAPDATGDLTNVAALTLAPGVTDIGTAPDSAQDTTTLIPTVDLGLDKTDAQATTRPGEILTYTLLISNTGPSSAISATLTDTFPAQISGISWVCAATPGSACPASGSGDISATVMLAPNGALTITITGTVVITASGVLTNTAYVTAPPGVTESGPLPNSATDTTTIVPFEADLTVTTSGPLTATPGTALTFTVAVYNAGPDVAGGARFTDTFPAELSNVMWTCAAAGGAACPANGAGDITALITLPVNSAVTFTVSGDIDSAATGVLTHTATATPPQDFGDPQPDDNQSTLSVPLIPQGDLSLSLTDGQSIADPGDMLTYTLVITNTGPSTLAGTLVTDTFPARLSNVLWWCSASGGSACPASGSGDIAATLTVAPGGSVTFTITALITASGALTNTASVAPPPGAIDPDSDNNTASDFTQVISYLYLPIVRR